MQHIGQAAIAVILILFLMYRRIRKTVGSQPFQPRKLKVRIGIFAAFGVLLLATGWLHPIVWAGDAAGLIAGGALAWLAARYNRFEWQGTALYYRTHTAIQAVVVALFVGRVAYRFLVVNQQIETATAATDNQAQMQSFTRDPWTAAVIFVLVAFYIGYYSYILRKGRTQSSDQNRRSDETQAS